MPTLTSMQQLADNQIGNQFMVNFASIPGSPAHDLTNLSLRASASAFTFPDEVVSEYVLHIRGIPGVFPGTVDETDKAFTIQIVLDAGWKQYDAFAKWKGLVFNKENAKVGLLADITTTVSVSFYGALGSDAETATKVIYFENVWLKSLKIGDTDPASNEPTRIDCTFRYLRMKDIG